MSFRVELANSTNLLLREIADSTCKRRVVAQTYRLALESSEDVDFAAVNAAIIKRWSVSALNWIKTQAHSGRCFAGKKEST